MHASIGAHREFEQRRRRREKLIKVCFKLNAERSRVKWPADEKGGMRIFECIASVDRFDKAPSGINSFLCSSEARECKKRDDHARMCSC